MSITRKAEIASEMILVQIDELDKIVKDAIPTRDITTAGERMGRWKIRTVRILSEKVNTRESKSLESKRAGSYWPGEPLSYVTVEHEIYRAFLTSLLEELKNHPEELFRPSPDVGTTTTSAGIPTPVRQGYVFIAMPMDKKDALLEDVHVAIKEAATDSGLQAERVDAPQTNERISPRILESLRTAEFVVADLTHSKPNVYFEAGYAEAIGRTPVYIARAGTDLEFDVQDYPVIFFENVTNLKRDLTHRLKGLKSGAT
jgi:hypothetical protein